MKTFKRIGALALTLALLFALSIPAFAATITVSGVEGQTYNAYKIFSVTKTGDGETAGYSYTASKAIYDLLYTSGVSNVPGVELKATTDANIFNVVMTNDEATAKKLADFLYLHRTALGTAAATGTIASGSSSVDLTVEEAGYYFVDSSLGALCILKTATEKIAVTEKNEKPDIEKTVGEKEETVGTYDVGDSVPFTLTVKAGGNAATTYVVHDTMTDGLSLNADSFQIKDPSGKLIDSKYYTITTTGLNDSCTFEIEFKQAYTANLAKGAEIVITYTATLTQEAVHTVPGDSNKVKLTFGNTSTVEKEVKVYTGSIIIDKRAEGEEGKKLSGAKFVLKNDDGKYYCWTNDQVDWVDSYKNGEGFVDGCVLTTDDNGYAEFKGLKAGTYKLVEIEAPQGYNLLADEIRVTVFVNDEDGKPAYVHHTETVINQSGNLLPSTGGIGTTIFYIVGGLLVITAGVLLITKKRMNRAEG